MTEKSPPAHHRTTLSSYIFATKACINNRQYLLHMSSQYGELRLSNVLDRFGSLRHPSKFQRFSRSVLFTAARSLTGGQPNFPRCLAVFWAGTLANIVVSVLVATLQSQMDNYMYSPAITAPCWMTVPVASFAVVAGIIVVVDFTVAAVVGAVGGTVVAGCVVVAAGSTTVVVSSTDVVGPNAATPGVSHAFIHISS